MLVDDEKEKKIDDNIENELEKELEVNTANVNVKFEMISRIEI
jgi:hypothetical protein